MTSFAVGAATDTGQVRAATRIAISFRNPVVADGMGGHIGGEIALKSPSSPSRRSTRSVRSTNSSAVLRRRMPPSWSEPVLSPSCAAWERPCVLADIERPGSNRLGVANVGDSRLYRLTADGLFQHTEDHSLVEALVRDGRLTRAEAAVHPQRNIVTRALGIDEKVLVDAWELIPVEGDRYLLCSDGLFNEVPEPEIAEVLRAQESPEDAAHELVERANDAGGRDNITVVVVDVVTAGSFDALPADRVSDTVTLPEDACVRFTRARRSAGHPFGVRPVA